MFIKLQLEDCVKSLFLKVFLVIIYLSDSILQALPRETHNKPQNPMGWAFKNGFLNPAI